MLAHILSSVPEETSNDFAILDAIHSGANTPDTVDKHLRQRFQLSTEEDISTTFLTTQRTGAISRMADIGLIARRKQGLRVAYFVTQQGAGLHAQSPTSDHPQQPGARRH